MYGDGVLHDLCFCVPQFYSSKEKSSSKESDKGESVPVKLLRELLEDALPPNSLEEELSSQPSPSSSSHSSSSNVSTKPGYSTSYCWPPLLSGNNSTLGLHRHLPAQSCEHILNVNATAANGFYWIDPNLGCSSDAIMVYCNFTSNETCIHPNSTQVM